jgi:type II secretory pathway pseudopilin PulG
MKLKPHFSGPIFLTPGKAAFTMVEIALSLAIIGFALVAIIGVLPAGLNVQKNNREETIVTQDANYFMDAIRSGARGLDDLTNNIISITNFWTIYRTNVNLLAGETWQVVRSGIDGYTGYFVSPANLRLRSSRTSYAPAVDDFPLDDGFSIIGLLSRLKFEPVDNATGAIDLQSIEFVRSNHIVAIFRAVSGAAAEKSPQTNSIVQDLAFTYRLVPEVSVLPQVETNSAYSLALQSRLHEVRLKYAWPVLPRNQLGNGRQTFRTLVGGLHQSQLVSNNAQIVYFFNPTVY